MCLCPSRLLFFKQIDNIKFMNIQKQIDAQYQNSFRKVSELLPAVDIVTKNYSLEPDMIFGWKPKMKIVGPVPLNFDNNIVDIIIEQLTTYGRKYSYKVIYLGVRPQSSYKLHQQIKHQYEYKYAYLSNVNYNHLAAFYRKFYSHFQSKKIRLFKGMNPMINNEDDFIFEANYQSGNLDAAIKVGPNQYDIFMRIDSNTRGHNQWFNFTIKNNKKRKIKLNICNFRKEKTLLQRGMKPYVYSKHLYDTKRIEWRQDGQNIKFSKEVLRYKFLQQEGFTQNQTTFYCLKFQYQFESDYDEVSFAYCPPYTYSQMLRFVRTLVQKDKYEQYVKQHTFCESLSGLVIPMLTITDFSVPNKNKKCILVSARIHPGESNGSYLMQGFLEYVCGNTKEAADLRQKIVIKAIPMLNPDGVVMGNFRTSLCGKDLNRVFKIGIDMLFPQVKFLKELVLKLKQQYNNRLILFLDFHGHSVKKNVFIYGPEYGLFESNYYKTRILPKIISNITEMFRFYSCSFRISYQKRTTARAVLLKNIPHCYTIEASTGFYYSRQQKRDIQFDVNLWKNMGRFVCEGLKLYIDLLIQEEILLEQKRKKLKQQKILKKKQKLKNFHQDKFLNTDKYIRNDIPTHNRERKMRQSSINSINSNNKIIDIEIKQLPEVTQNLINQIKKDEESKKIQENKEDHESDKFSEGGSDSQSKDDLAQDEINKLHNGIIDSMEEFQLKFSSKRIQKKQSKHKPIRQKQKDILRQKERKIDLIPSLRKKNIQQPQIDLKRNSLNKDQVFNWPRIQQQFLIRTSNLKNTTKFFNKTQLNPLHFNHSFINDITQLKQI